MATSISSFTVLVTRIDGQTETYDNNAKGFPVSDSVIVQTRQSCVNNGKLKVVAAVSFGIELSLRPVTNSYIDSRQCYNPR